MLSREASIVTLKGSLSLSFFITLSFGIIDLTFLHYPFLVEIIGLPFAWNIFMLVQDRSKSCVTVITSKRQRETEQCSEDFICTWEKAKAHWIGCSRGCVRVCVCTCVCVYIYFNTLVTTHGFLLIRRHTISHKTKKNTHAERCAACRHTHAPL